jgi:UDP-N-acetylmuramoylalanine--D-glutamate ligase
LAQLDGTRTVVKSPGVPREAPVIAAALERGIEVLGELELAWRAIPTASSPSPAPTARRPRSSCSATSTASAGEPVAVAGNVGTPLARWPASRADATVVCEASSFQLEDTSPSRPSARSSSTSPPTTSTATRPRAYLAAKLRIFANQGNDDVAVYNADDPALAGTDLGGCARRVAFCRGAAPTARSRCRGTIFYDGEPLLAVDELGLFGEHNVANAMAAAAAALAMGLDRDAVREGLRSFAGVPHRLEQVAEIGGVRFVNDSKATNVASAAVGIAPSRAACTRSSAAARRASRSRRWSSRARALPRRYLIGAPRPAGRRAGAGSARACALHRCADLEDAVRSAAPRPRPGEVVLLSPACASFDAFENFERAASASARSSRGCGERAALAAGRQAAKAQAKREEARARRCPTEYNMLLTATLCLLAFGAVMVFSASSTTRCCSDGGLSDSAFYLKRTLIFGASACRSCT